MVCPHAGTAVQVAHRTGMHTAVCMTGALILCPAGPGGPEVGPGGTHVKNGFV